MCNELSSSILHNKYIRNGVAVALCTGWQKKFTGKCQRSKLSWFFIVNLTPDVVSRGAQLRWPRALNAARPLPEPLARRWGWGPVAGSGQVDAIVQCQKKKIIGHQQCNPLKNSSREWEEGLPGYWRWQWRSIFWVNCPLLKIILKHCQVWYISNHVAKWSTSNQLITCFTL